MESAVRGSRACHPRGHWFWCRCASSPTSKVGGSQSRLALTPKSMRAELNVITQEETLWHIAVRVGSRSVGRDS